MAILDRISRILKELGKKMANLDRIVTSHITVSGGVGSGNGTGPTTPPPPTYVSPGPVTSLIATVAGTTSIGVTWAPPATGSAPFTYDLRYRATGDSVNTTVLGVASGVVINGLTPDTSYDVEIRAVGPGGTGAWTTVVAITDAVPVVPGLVTALAATTTSTTVTSTWGAPATGATPFTYDLRYHIGSGAYTTLTGVVSGHVVTGLTPSTAYNFEVRAVGPGGAGGWTVLPKTTDAAPVAPGVVTSLAASALSSTSLQIMWAAPATGTAPFTYDLQYRIGTGTYSTIATGVVSPRNVTGLAPDTSYNVEIRAVGPGGTGPWSVVAGTTNSVEPIPDFSALRLYHPENFVKPTIGSPVAGVSYAPVVPQPATADEVVGMVLAGPPGTALAARYKTIAYAFAPGAVHTTDDMDVFYAGTAHPCQMDVKATHLDGSVHHALLSFMFPAWNGSTATSAMVRKNAIHNGAANVVLTSGALGAFTGSVTAVSRYPYTADGSGVASAIGTSYNISPATLLAADVTPDYWMQGPIGTQRRFTGLMVDALRYVLDVTQYVDGSVDCEWEVMADNQFWTQGIQPTSWGVTIALLQGGTAIHTVTNYRLYQAYGLGKQAFSGVAAAVNVLANPPEHYARQDHLYLTLNGDLPPYNYSVGVNNTWVTARQDVYDHAGFRTPGFTNGFTSPGMGGPGARQDIGFLPGWHSGYYQSGDYKLFMTMIAQAEAVRTLPINQFDPVSKLPLNIFPTIGHPDAWFDWRDTAMTNYHPVDDQHQPTDWDGAHQPMCAYSAYLATGRRMHWDALSRQANFTLGAVWTAQRTHSAGGITKDWVVVMSEQVRAAGWSLRDISMCLHLTPDTSPFKTRFRDLLKFNFDYLIENSEIWKSKQGEPFGWLVGISAPGNTDIKPWMNDHFFVGCFTAWQAGCAEAWDFMARYASNFISGRGDFVDTSINWKAGEYYGLVVNNTNVLTDPVIPNTWAGLYAPGNVYNNGPSGGWDASGNYAQLWLRSLAIERIMLKNAKPLTVTAKVAGVGPFTTVAAFRDDAIDDFAPLALASGVAQAVPGAYGTPVVLAVADNNAQYTVATPVPPPMIQEYRTKAGSAAYGPWLPFFGNTVNMAGLVPETSYLFQIRGSNSTGAGATSPEYGFTTLPGEVVVPPPDDAPTAPFANGTGIERIFGMRQLVGSYTGPLIRAKNFSNVELDIPFNTTTRWVDYTALDAHIGAAAEFQIKWYDQSGNAKHLDANWIKCQRTDSLFNNKPCVVVDSSSYPLSSSANLTIASPASAVVVLVMHTEEAAGTTRDLVAALRTGQTDEYGDVSSFAIQDRDSMHILGMRTYFHGYATPPLPRGEAHAVGWEMRPTGGGIGYMDNVAGVAQGADMPYGIGPATVGLGRTATGGQAYYSLQEFAIFTNVAHRTTFYTNTKLAYPGVP